MVSRRNRRRFPAVSCSRDMRGYDHARMRQWMFLRQWLRVGHVERYGHCGGEARQQVILLQMSATSAFTSAARAATGGKARVQNAARLLGQRQLATRISQQARKLGSTCASGMARDAVIRVQRPSPTSKNRTRRACGMRPHPIARDRECRRDACGLARGGLATRVARCYRRSNRSGYDGAPAQQGSHIPPYLRRCQAPAS